VPTEKPVPADIKATSMRDDFDKAIKDVEDDADGATTTETELDNAEAITAEDFAQDETGEAPKTEAAAEETETETSGKESGAEEAASDDAAGMSTDGVSDDKSTGIAKAPASWSPTFAVGHSTCLLPRSRTSSS